MLLATVPLAIAATLTEGPPTSIKVNADLLEELFFIGAIATSACFVISAEFGRRVSTFAMSNFTMGVPLVGIVFSCLTLEATVSGKFLLGLCLVVFGVVIAALVARNTARS
ncbi:hypothetical protein D3C73_1242700 [compost metagenome]